MDDSAQIQWNLLPRLLLILSVPKVHWILIGNIRAKEEGKIPQMNNKESKSASIKTWKMSQFIKGKKIIKSHWKQSTRHIILPCKTKFTFGHYSIQSWISAEVPKDFLNMNSDLFIIIRYTYKHTPEDSTLSKQLLASRDTQEYFLNS